MRSKRASRPSRSHETSNRPGPWPRAAAIGPRNASPDGRPCGPYARAAGAAEVALRASDREADREKRKGADVGRADTILAQGAEALEAKEYAKVRGFAKDAHDAVREASLLKTVREAFASLRLDAEDIRTMGAEVTNFEGMLVELGKAIEGNDLPTARRLVSQARRRAESTG